MLLGGAGSDQLFFNGGDTEIIRLIGSGPKINEGGTYQLSLIWPSGAQQATIAWGDGTYSTASAPQTNYSHVYARDSATQPKASYEVLVSYVNADGRRCLLESISSERQEPRFGSSHANAVPSHDVEHGVLEQ